MAMLRIILDRYLVVVVDVGVVEELLRESAKETRAEETLQLRFIVSHQTIAICIQTIKDSLQDLNSLQVIELLNGNFSISVYIKVRTKWVKPPQPQTMIILMTPKNWIKNLRQPIRHPPVCDEVVANNL